MVPRHRAIGADDLMAKGPSERSATRTSTMWDPVPDAWPRAGFGRARSGTEVARRGR